MNIKSIIRKERYYRTLFIAIFLAFVSSTAIYNLNKEIDLNIIPLSLSLFIICLVGSFAIQIFLDDEKYRQIIIDENGIYLYYYLFNKPRQIQFENINGFETIRKKLYSSRTPISDGFLSTCFTMKDGSNFYITEDTFVNYREIVTEIIIHMKD